MISFVIELVKFISTNELMFRTTFNHIVGRPPAVIRKL